MRPRLKKRDHQEYVLHHARELPESGRFEGWLSIEFELRDEGIQEARVWLDSKSIREELDILCQQAKTRRLPPTSKKAPKGTK
jgi:hypothetical protein